MKSVGYIKQTTKRSYTDYYLLEVTFYRLRVPRKILPQITQIYTLSLQKNATQSHKR